MQKIDIKRTPTRYALVDNFSGGQPAQRTEVFVRADDYAIYITFRAEEKCLKVIGTQFNDPLWEGDIVEVMLTLGKDDHYLEIEVNPNGVQYAVLIDNLDMQGDIRITKLDRAPFVSSVTRAGDIWETRITIPFDNLKALGWDAKTAKLNLYRQDYDLEEELRLSALSPTMCGKFHVPSAYVAFAINSDEK